jgi:glycosyltransferase involved in cell wall biosynthesis
MVKALLSFDVEILLVLPARYPVYFNLSRPEHADALPPIILSDALRERCNDGEFGDGIERLRRLEILSYADAYMLGAHWSQIYRMLVGAVLPHIQFDLIHAHDWLAYTAGIWAREQTGKPLICHVHSTEYDRACGEGNTEIHRLEGDGLLAADRIVAVSRRTADSLEEHYGVDSTRVRVVYNACSIDEVPVKVKGSVNERVVLFLGRMTKQKGPHIFLELVSRIAVQHRDVRFILSGDGDLWRFLVKKSAEYKLGTRILFTGFLNRKEVQHILSMTDILVAPSLSDPFGIVVLEAMRCGVAVMVSIQSGAAEVVRSVVPVDCQDVDGMAATLSSLLQNPKRTGEIGRAAQDEVRKMGWTGAAETLKEIYEEAGRLR